MSTLKEGGHFKKEKDGLLLALRIWGGMLVFGGVFLEILSQLSRNYTLADVSAAPQNSPFWSIFRKETSNLIWPDYVEKVFAVHHLGREKFHGWLAYHLYIILGRGGYKG